MNISYKKINNYEWIVRKYLKLLLKIKNVEQYKQGIEEIINKIYTLSSKEQNFCNLIGNFIIIDTSLSPAGANNVVKQLKIRQNEKIRTVQSIQKTFPPKHSFLPVNKKLILRKGLKENKKCIDTFIENDYWCLQLIDPFSEIFINSFLSIIYDLQASISVCKTYGYFLCDKKITDYEEFNVNQIIEESSFTVDYVIETLDLSNNNKDLILSDAILQLFYSLDNLKKWCGFVHFDLSPRNVMIANYHSTMLNCLKNVKFLGKSIIKAKYLILNDSKNNIFITKNNKFVLKIIDYGYSCLFFKYASNESILKMNNEISVMLDYNKCLSGETSLIKTIGSGSGLDLYNALKTNRTVENYYSDLYFFLIQIIWKIYSLNIQNNFPIFFNTLKDLFGLEDKNIREFILPVALAEDPINPNIPFARYKRNIESYVHYYLINEYKNLHKNYNVPDINGKKIFMYNLNQQEKREIEENFRINDKYYFRDSNYFHLNIDPDFYKEIINEINPIWDLIKRFDNSICKKSQKTMQTLIPSTIPSLKKYNVKIQDYNKGFNNLNQYNKYIFDAKEYVYSFYKFIFLWNELLERSLQTTQNNIWFDGTNKKQQIIGTLVNVIELGNNAKINIDIVNKKIDKFVFTNEEQHRHQFFINGNYFIIPYNYTNILNPPYASDKNGYPIGYYFKRKSKQIMGTVCQFPPELLEHYAVIWGYNEPFRIYCTPYYEFLNFHEIEERPFNYASVHDKTQIYTKNVENIKMKDSKGCHVIFGNNVIPILKNKSMKLYDFAFTTGPYLVKDNQIYFTESLLNQQMFYKDIPITYNSHNNDNYIFKTKQGINTTGTTIYGEKHSNWIMSHTIIGFQGNLVKFFLIEGRGFDFPGLDRKKVAKILHEKFGITNAISLDGGFSSNAVYFSESENGWRKIIDMPEERYLGLVIALTN